MNADVSKASFRWKSVKQVVRLCVVCTTVNRVMAFYIAQQTIRLTSIIVSSGLSTSYIGHTSRLRRRPLSNLSTTRQCHHDSSSMSCINVRGGGRRWEKKVVRPIAVLQRNARRYSAIRNFMSQISNVEQRHKSRRITFVTDVEGDRDYMERYVEMSKVICFRPITDSDRAILTLDGLHFPYDQCIDFIQMYSQKQKQEIYTSDDIFVFGGDAWDQGGSDLWVIRQLVFFKQRYPNSVYLIIGNRDVNKMRVLQELGVNDPMPQHYGAYWLKGTRRPGDPNNGPFPESQTAVERLKWMLTHTMGSPRAFEYRKWELQQERINDSDIVTDEDVVESYRSSCHPETGEMGKYLANANLFLRLGEAAFVHGGLPITPKLLENDEKNIFRIDFWNDMKFAMPWLTAEECQLTATELGVNSVDDWIKSLNQFAGDCVLSWKSEFRDLNHLQKLKMWSWTGGYLTPGVPRFSHLIQYGMGSLPDRTPNPTVVYNGWRHFLSDDDTADDDKEQDIFVRQTQNFMVQTGIRLICCGHQPQGDMPNAIRVHLPNNATETAWIVSADTSYSGDTIWVNLPSDDPNQTRENIGRGNVKSGRGPVAVSEVLIEQCCETGKILDAYFHGKLSDGTDYRSYSLDFDGALSDKMHTDLIVGKIARGQLIPSVDQIPHAGVWWTRAAFKSDNSLLLVARQGFNVWNRIVRT